MAAPITTMPVVSIDINMFWQIINFLILMVIFRKYLREPLSKILSARKEAIATELSQAEEAKKIAEQNRKEMEEILKNAKKEASVIINTAEKKAFEREESIIKDAHTHRDKIIRAAELEKGKMEESLKKELTSTLRETAAMMAAELVAKNMNTETKDKLLNEFIDEVGEAKW